MTMEPVKECYYPQLSEMISGIESWLKANDYNYIECNHVPERLFGNILNSFKNTHLNIL